MAPPRLDFSITSPPYMNRRDHPQNPLTGYQTPDGDHATYSDEVRSVCAGLRDLLKPGGRAVINAANIRGPGVSRPSPGISPTPPAKSCASSARSCFAGRDRPVPHFTNDYCLVFVQA